MLEKHAEDVLLLDLRPVSSIADLFVLATAQTQRQVQAIAEHLEDELRKAGRRVRHMEGLVDGRSRSSRGRRRAGVRRSANSEDESDDWPAADELIWVLVDCGDVVVHLFNPPARNFYQLEHLWADAPRLPIEEHAIPDIRQQTAAISKTKHG